MKRLSLVAIIAFLAACGGSTRPVRGPTPFDVTPGELLDAHRTEPWANRYHGLLIKMNCTITDVDPTLHIAYRRLKASYEPIISFRLAEDCPKPIPGRYECVATVLRADMTPGERGVPDLCFTLVLTDAHLRPVD
jgi:hypothetical protein